jgi:cation diffusion facilitator CzcD-associated flavoprotein CzcO
MSAPTRRSIPAGSPPSPRPGWQQRWLENFTANQAGGTATEDLVQDGWTDLSRRIRRRILTLPKEQRTREGMLAAFEDADHEKMEEIRARVDAIIDDPETAEALKPYYRQFCKRPCFHDEYLDTFNRPNVTLVDTKGRGVERITENGVVVDGTEYELDCLIYATGFEVGTDYTRRSGYELYGRGGVTLTEKWSNGVATLHGMHSRGFPNCFIISNAQSGFTVNFPHMLNEQAKHLAYVVKHALDQEVRAVEVSEEAEAAWVETIVSLARNGLDYLEACTPGYYNNEGKPAGEDGSNGTFFGRAQNGPYGGGPIAFVKLLEDWRAEGSLAGMELR